MKNICIILLFILITSCSKKPIKKTPVKKIKINISYHALIKFLKTCEQDMERAKKVLNDKDIITNLSHLNFMNSGGKRYYLLERENITKMILSVTKGIYLDFILIKKGGQIIYTRSDDSLFNKNVKSSLFRDTILEKSYKSRKEKVYFWDITEYPKRSGKYHLYISSLVYDKKNVFPGIFILQVDYKKIIEKIKPEDSVISFDGKVRLSHKLQPGKTFTPFPDIVKNSIRDRKKLIVSHNSVKYFYQHIPFKQLDWIVVSPEK